jgi:nucleotide-binding universal stress UspA family protein
MGPVKHILLAVDGLDSSSRATVMAILLATSLNAHVTCLHAVHVAPVLDAAGVDLPDDIIDALRTEGQDVLDRVLQRARDVGVACSATLVESAPAHAILELATAGADLIVMGTHRQTGVSRAIIGSVTEAVLRDSVVPVLVVPPWGK